MAQTKMGNPHLLRNTTQDHDIMAPVELECVARVELQRNIALINSATAALQAYNIAAHSVV